MNLVAGRVLNVSSNQRQETLGHYLMARGTITEQQHHAAVSLAQQRGEKLGGCLVELGALDSGELLRALLAQARYKLTTTLRWTAGCYQYESLPELLDVPKGSAIDVPSTVFVALRSSSRSDTAFASARQLGTSPLELTARGQKFEAACAHAFGEEITAAIRRGVTAPQLLTERGAEAVLPALEALVLTGCLPSSGDAGRDLVGSAPKTSPVGLEDLSRRFIGPEDEPLDLGEDPGVQEFSDPVPSARRKRNTLGGMEPPRSSRQRMRRPSFAGLDPLQLPSSAQAQTEPLVGSLYDLIFGDETGGATDMPLFDVSARDVTPAGGAMQAIPEEAPDMELDSGIVDFFAHDATQAAEDNPEALKLKEALLTEFLRVQDKDWYQVLGLRKDAGAGDIETAHGEKTAAFRLEDYAPHDLGSDYSKLEEIHAAYRRARDTLLDSYRRAVYDAKLRKQRTQQAQPQAAFSAEMEFRRGEELLEAGDHDAALVCFRTALGAEPHHADYHAALGWALFRRSETERGHDDPRSAGYDRAEALESVSRALAIDPDHGAAHEHLGCILAPADQDPERAADHLERALETPPVRMSALDALDELLVRRGEMRRLEARYRTLLGQLEEDQRDMAARLWRRLGDLYRNHMHQPESAQLAFQCAARLAPADGRVLFALDDLLAGQPERFDDRTEALRARWRLEPADPAPGLELMRAALGANQAELAYLAASALVARQADDPEALALHQRYRPRFLVRLQNPLDGDTLAVLRHPDDDPALNALFAALEPIAQTLDPLSMADLDIRESSHVAEDALPDSFARVRSYVAETLGLEEPAVYERRDFGAQVHVAALEQPVLLAGPDILHADDRVQLCFALTRSMTYLFGGRGLAGSRPARFLKSLFLACVDVGGAEDVVRRESPEVKAMFERARDALSQESPEFQSEVGALATGIAEGRERMNLTVWARSLARTSDRLGLLMCGDLAVAFRGARAMGTAAAADDLLDFALSSPYMEARRAVGISIDV